MMRCPLCGYSFDPTGAQACQSCGHGGTCAMLCCPNCGYKVPGQSRLERWIKSLKRGKNDGQDQR